MHYKWEPCPYCGGKGVVAYPKLKPAHHGNTRPITSNELPADVLDEVRDLLNVLLNNDPDDPISDAGHTVLDMWRNEARTALAKLSAMPSGEQP